MKFYSLKMLQMISLVNGNAEALVILSNRTLTTLSLIIGADFKSPSQKDIFINFSIQQKFIKLC